MGRGESKPERQREGMYSTHGERKVRTTQSKTNTAAIVTNTAGQKSSNSTLLGGTVGTDPAQKSAAYYNKAFYGEVRSVHSKLTETHLLRGGPERVITDHMYSACKGPHIPPLNERHLQVNRSGNVIRLLHF